MTEGRISVVSAFHLQNRGNLMDFSVAVCGDGISADFFTVCDQLLYAPAYLAVTIYLPHVRGIQPQARDISLPKLYNGRAMV